MSRIAGHNTLKSALARELTRVAPAAGAVLLSGILTTAAVGSDRTVSSARSGAHLAPVAAVEAACSTPVGVAVGIGQPQLNQLAGLAGRRAKKSAWRQLAGEVFSTLNECPPPSGTSFREGFSVAAPNLHAAIAAARLATRLTAMAGGELNMPVGYEGTVRPDAYFGQNGVATLEVGVDSGPVDYWEQVAAVNAIIDPHFARDQRQGF